MRHTRLLAGALALGGFLGQVAPADAAAPVFATPGLLTSSGQASDVVVVKALLNTKLKLGLTAKPVAGPEDLAGMKCLVLVVGASVKGLGAAGLDMEKETARTVALLQAARAQKLPVLVMHTGGESRRGKTSNDLIQVVVPEADYVVVVASGNKDKFFQTLAGKRETPVVEVETLAAAGEAVKALFP